MKENTFPTFSKTWLYLTIPMVALILIAAGAGVFVPNTYERDAPYFAAQGVAQDAVILVVAVPVLLATMVLALRGSQKAMLVWLGCVSYVVYSYILYAFLVAWNQLFLVYCGVLGLSLYALVGGVVSLLKEPRLQAGIKKGARRAVQILFVAAAVMFYFTWLSEIIPAMLTNTTPQSVIDNGLPSNPVHVLDLAILLPALLLTTYWLGKGRPLGTVLAGTLLGFLVFMGLTVLALVVMLVVVEGYPWEPPLTVIFLIFTTWGLATLAAFLHGLGVEK